MKKYTLEIDEKFPGLFRIRAAVKIERFGVSPGDLGGLISGEKNLSHYGDAWVSGNAQVYGNALVSGNARVYGDAWVSGNAQVYGDAWVYGNARVYGDAWVSGNAQVYGNSRVSGDALVPGNAQVYGNSRVQLKTDCIYISNLRYDITITPQNISIGCQLKTFSEWMEVKRKDTDLTLEEFKTIRSLLKLLKF